MTEHRTHSDGPWSACKVGECQCGMIWDASGNCLVAIAQGATEHLDRTGSGTGPDCVPTDHIQKANSCLIAAAPDMLEALKWVETRMLGRLPDRNTMNETEIEEYKQAYEKLIRTAIAKATKGAP